MITYSLDGKGTTKRRKLYGCCVQEQSEQWGSVRGSLFGVKRVVHSLVLRKRMKLAYLNNSTCCLVKALVFPVVMYGCESWTIKKAEHWGIDTFELWCWRRLENPLDCKEIQPVHPKGHQSWMFTGRTDAEAETPILRPPHAKSWLIGKDPDAGKDWRQEEKGMTEDEMVGWHHWLDGHGFGWTPGVGDGQGDLACCGSWGHKEMDATEWLNWAEHAISKLKSTTQN